MWDGDPNVHDDMALSGDPYSSRVAILRGWCDEGVREASLI